MPKSRLGQCYVRLGSRAACSHDDRNTDGRVKRPRKLDRSRRQDYTPAQRLDVRQLARCSPSRPTSYTSRFRTTCAASSAEARTDPATGSHLKSSSPLSSASPAQPCAKRSCTWSRQGRLSVATGSAHSCPVRGRSSIRAWRFWRVWSAKLVGRA